MLLKLAGFPLFVFILLGQSAALLGATVTNFALGLWAYEKAGSVADYTWIAVASTLPAIFAGPLLGVFIDRWPRKQTLLLAQMGNALVLGAVTALYYLDRLSVSYIVMIVPFGAIFGTILQISFTSTVSSLVGKDRLNQANGLIGLVFGLIQLAGPLLGGIALDHFSLEYILDANLLAYVIAILALAISAIPNVASQHADQTRPSVLSDLKNGFSYLSSKPGLMGGLWMFTLIWFGVSVIQVLFVPMALGIGTKTDLGFIQTCAGFGLLIGGILMVTWKGPQRLVYGIAIPCFGVSISFTLLPLSTHVNVIAFSSFVAMAMIPLANASSQTLWQRKILPAYQGRVFALRSTIMKAAQPLAYICAGYLADSLFEPNMAVGGAWSEAVGEYWGAGKGRGAALLMSLFGMTCFLLVSIGFSIRSIRRSDIDLPDYEIPTETAKPSS